MGAIQTCIDFGFPHGLLLCVIPWNAGWTRGNGKAVGKFDAPTGRFKGDDAWRSGQPLALKMEADPFG